MNADRVTLDADELGQLAYESGHSGHFVRGLIAPAVERILAAREKALREEIAREIEDASTVDMVTEYEVDALNEAARIARGGPR